MSFGKNVLWTASLVGASISTTLAQKASPDTSKYTFTQQSDLPDSLAQEGTYYGVPILSAYDDASEKHLIKRDAKDVPNRPRGAGFKRATTSGANDLIKVDYRLKNKDQVFSNASYSAIFLQSELGPVDFPIEERLVLAQHSPENTETATVVLRHMADAPDLMWIENKTCLKTGEECQTASVLYVSNDKKSLKVTLENFVKQASDGMGPIKNAMSTSLAPR